MLHPFLNILLNKLNKKQYQLLLFGLIFIWSIIPTFTTSSFQSNNLLWFISLYVFASYIRLYGLNKKFNTKTYFYFWLLFSVLTYLTSVILMYFGTKNIPLASSRVTYFYDLNTISVLLISLSLFMLFLNLKINYHKNINLVASTTFGIYLIHDSDLIRYFLWLDLFKNASYQNSLLLIPYSIVVVLVVFIVCFIVDLIRQKTIEKLYMKFVDKYIDDILKFFRKIYLFFRNIVFGQD